MFLGDLNESGKNCLQDPGKQKYRRCLICNTEEKPGSLTVNGEIC